MGTVWYIVDKDTLWLLFFVGIGLFFDRSCRQEEIYSVLLPVGRNYETQYLGFQLLPCLNSTQRVGFVPINNLPFLYGSGGISPDALLHLGGILSNGSRTNPQTAVLPGCIFSGVVLLWKYENNFMVIL